MAPEENPNARERQLGVSFGAFSVICVRGRS